MLIVCPQTESLLQQYAQFASITNVAPKPTDEEQSLEKQLEDIFERVRHTFHSVLLQIQLHNPQGGYNQGWLTSHSDANVSAPCPYRPAELTTVHSAKQHSPNSPATSTPPPPRLRAPRPNPPPPTPRKAISHGTARSSHSTAPTSRSSATNSARSAGAHNSSNPSAATLTTTARRTQRRQRRTTFSKRGDGLIAVIRRRIVCLRGRMR